MTAGSRITSTGVHGLDLALDGGVPAGTRIVIISPPLCGVDLFARQFWTAGKQRGTYLMLDTRPLPGMVDARDLPLSGIREEITGSHVVIDSLSTAIRKFGVRDAVDRLMQDVAGEREGETTILYILYAGMHPPAEEAPVLRSADIVFSLEEKLRGSEYERILSIHKLAGMRVPERVIPYHITAGGLELSTTSRIV
ncbi:MAG: RAD55 family ATPase [Methanoculleaceae archaeon]